VAPPRGIGFAVAGGRSTRMGRDKALLPWGPAGATLLDHAIACLSEVCGEVRILGGALERYGDRGLRVVPDAIEDAGPLAGVLAGLESSAEGGLFLGVDLPCVTPALLSLILDAAAGHDAVVPVTADGAQPLCAWYGPACASAIRKRLTAGERKMTCFWLDIRVRELREGDLAPAGDPAALFRNLNTPGDYEVARTTCG